MKCFVLAIFAVLLVAISARPEDAKEKDDKYTTKYDNIDLDEIIKSDRLLKNYFLCLMDRGPCTPDGQELKNNVVDALKTECSKCSEIQRTGARKVFRHLIENKRDWFDELEAKYDKEQEFRKKYDAELKKEGLKL